MNTSTHAEPKRMGRPPKAPEDRKSATMRFRTREGLREQLEEAALASGRSPSEEAEIRLINSFKLEPLHQLYFGNGKCTTDFLHDMLAIIRTVQEYENPKGRRIGSKDWSDSELTREALRAAFAVLIPVHLPAPPRPEAITNPPEEQRAYGAALEHMRDLGKDLAKAITGQRPDLVERIVRPNVAEQ